MKAPRPWPAPTSPAPCGSTTTRSRRSGRPSAGCVTPASSSATAARRRSNASAPRAATAPRTPTRRRPARTRRRSNSARSPPRPAGYTRQLSGILTRSQWQSYAKLLGDPFDFTRLRGPGGRRDPAKDAPAPDPNAKAEVQHAAGRRQARAGPAKRPERPAPRGSAGPMTPAACGPPARSSRARPGRDGPRAISDGRRRVHGRVDAPTVAGLRWARGPSNPRPTPMTNPDAPRDTCAASSDSRIFARARCRSSGAAGGPVGGGDLPDGGRQEPLLSVARPAARRPDGGGLAADRPDEGSDRLPGRRGAWRRRGWIRAWGAGEAREILGRLREGQIKLLYVVPERLANERFLQTLGRLPIDLLAVDEAHCISEWGHNFRPDYMKLARLAVELKVGRVLALTATATPDVGAGHRAGLPRRRRRRRADRLPQAEPDPEGHADRRRPPRGPAPGADRGQAARADDRVCDPAADRRGRRRRSSRRRACRRRRTTRGSTPSGGTPSRTGSWGRRRHRRRHDRLRHGDRQGRTSATCTITTCPGDWRTTRRRSAAPGATARRRRARCSPWRPTTRPWRTSPTATRPPGGRRRPDRRRPRPAARRSTCRPTSCPATTTSARWWSRPC